MDNSPPFGGLYLVSMWHNVAPPAAGYYILCLGSWFTYYILCQCDKMSHRPAGGTISSGTTSCGLAPLGILHVAPPCGRLRGVVSMWHNVAPPPGARGSGPRAAQHTTSSGATKCRGRRGRPPLNGQSGLRQRATRSVCQIHPPLNLYKRKY